MMTLIQQREDSGYPTEYLLARIRGRRAVFFSGWEEILFHADPSEYLLKTQYGEFIEKYAVHGVWMKLLNEFQWAYSQMSKDMKHVFYPFFSLSELQTLFACFRFKSVRGAGTEIEKLLSFSLLSDTIKNILMLTPDLSAAVESFEKKVLPPRGRTGSLSDTLSKEGLAGVEQRLTALFFEDLNNEKLHPVLKCFFTFLTDAINIMSLYKCFRWNIETAPPMISGGDIRRTAARKLMQDRDMTALSRLTEKLTGIRIEDDRTSQIENALLSGLTKRIRAASRDNTDVGFILEYLWEIYVEVQNLSIILRGRDIEKDILREELTGL